MTDDHRIVSNLQCSTFSSTYLPLDHPFDPYILSMCSCIQSVSSLPCLSIVAVSFLMETRPVLYFLFLTVTRFPPMQTILLIDVGSTRI